MKFARLKIIRIFYVMRKIIANIISKISPSIFFRIAYFHNRGKWLNLKNPQDLSALWIKKVLKGEINEKAWLADKYAVRKYVQECVGESYLPKLLGVWENPNLIDFSKLPEKFALKLNYGAGMNIICTNKSILNIQNTIHTLQKWLTAPSYSFSESHYNLIPRKIICEEFISDENGVFPTDYKILCIKGKPFCILACSERYSGNPKFTMYSVNWEWLPDYQKEKPEEQKRIKRPKHLDKMLQIATKLAEGLDLIRVDLYDRGGGILFGEMTLTPAGCIFHTWTQKALDDAAKFYYSHKG